MTNGRVDVQTKVIVKVEDQFQIVQSILLYRLTITKSTVVELGPVPSYIFKILRDSTINLLFYRRRILWTYTWQNRAISRPEQDEIENHISDK